MTALSPVPTVARTVAHAPIRIASETRSRHGLGDSLVRCTLLQRPAHPGRPVSARRVVRFFAPTSQAVFFAHAGDRCVWRAGTAVRG